MLCNRFLFFNEPFASFGVIQNGWFLLCNSLKAGFCFSFWNPLTILAPLWNLWLDRAQAWGKKPAKSALMVVERPWHVIENLPPPAHNAVLAVSDDFCGLTKGSYRSGWSLSLMLTFNLPRSTIISERIKYLKILLQWAKAKCLHHIEKWYFGSEFKIKRSDGVTD